MQNNLQFELTGHSLEIKLVYKSNRHFEIH
jgi:hypothetical protein